MVFSVYKIEYEIANTVCEYKMRYRVTICRGEVVDVRGLVNETIIFDLKKLNIIDLNRFVTRKLSYSDKCRGAVKKIELDNGGYMENAGELVTIYTTEYKYQIPWHTVEPIITDLVYIYKHLRQTDL